MAQLVYSNDTYGSSTWVVDKRPEWVTEEQTNIKELQEEVKELKEINKIMFDRLERLEKWREV